MQNKPALWIDADGVLVDYTRGFLDYSGLSKAGYTYEDVQDYDLTKMFGSGKHAQDHTYELMRKFSESPEFHDLKPLALLTDLEALANFGFPMYVISQLGSKVARHSRVMNLTRLYGKVFKNIVFTQHGQSKLDFIKENTEYNDNIIIEDNPGVFRALKDSKYTPNAEFKLFGICIRHPYNRHVQRGYNHFTEQDFHGATDTIIKSVIQREVN